MAWPSFASGSRRFAMALATGGPRSRLTLFGHSKRWMSEGVKKPQDTEPGKKVPFLKNVYKKQISEWMKPVTAGLKPAIDGIKPAIDGIKPAIDGMKLAIDRMKPIVAQIMTQMKPITSKISEAVNSNRDYRVILVVVPFTLILAYYNWRQEAVAVTQEQLDKRFKLANQGGLIPMALIGGDPAMKSEVDVAGGVPCETQLTNTKPCSESPTDGANSTGDITEVESSVVKMVDIKEVTDSPSDTCEADWSSPCAEAEEGDAEPQGRRRRRTSRPSGYKKSYDDE